MIALAPPPPPIFVANATNNIRDKFQTRVVALGVFPAEFAKAVDHLAERLINRTLIKQFQNVIQPHKLHDRHTCERDYAYKINSD